MNFDIASSFWKKIVFLAGFIYCSTLISSPSQEKVLICGIAKDLEFCIENTIQNLEKLGDQFADYAVIIYENNSVDNTRNRFIQWANENQRVLFIGENLPLSELPKTRTDCIARARNKILDLAKRKGCKDFKYLIMVDLDFRGNLPFQEIAKTIESKTDWDCVCANGIDPDDEHYYDRFAFRSKDFPFGTEMLATQWWKELDKTKLTLAKDQSSWVPVYSAFGGLAIYKTSTIVQFSYSGKANKDLAQHYKKIMLALGPNTKHFQEYLKLLRKNSFVGSFLFDLNKLLKLFGKKNFVGLSKIPIQFLESACCEHVSLHASMSLRGFHKIYINPKMVVVRSLEEDRYPF